MPDLFILPPSALAHARLRAQLKRRGHAGQPGEGPAGETCKSCRWIKGVMGGNKRFSKCRHRTAPRMTNGTASDIQQRDPACGKWEKADA